MKDLKKAIKRFCLSILPENALLIIKRAHYVRSLRRISDDDELDLRIVKQILEPGDHVLDIGANIGVYTKYSSRLVGIHGCVYSIEPIPLTFEILRSNIKKLGLKNVKPINCAISDTNGFVIMEVPLYESGGRNYYQARIIAEDQENLSEVVKVESKTIDSLFLKLPHDISFIKCDVEGHELECIKGAKNIIKSQKPAWLIEISGNPDDPASSAYRTLLEMIREGYEVYWFDGATLRRRHLGDKSVNYFFLIPNHLRKLKGQNLMILDS